MVKTAVRLCMLNLEKRRLGKMGISENLKKGTSEMLILFLLEKEDM